MVIQPTSLRPRHPLLRMKTCLARDIAEPPPTNNMATDSQPRWLSLEQRQIFQPDPMENVLARMLL